MRYAGQCIDQLQTLTEWSGNEISDGVDGISLVPLLGNSAAKTEPRTFYWHYPFNVKVKHSDNGLPLTPHSGLRSGDYKLIWNWHGKVELFDIVKDLCLSCAISTALRGVCRSFSPICFGKWY